MTRSIKAIIVSLVVGSAVAGAATTATAAQPRKSAVVVRYGDLNLQSDAGAATLLGRLSYAANRICGVPTTGVAYFTERKQRHACRETALRNAVESVDNPVVTALYQSTRGGANTKLATLN